MFQVATHPAALPSAPHPHHSAASSSHHRSSSRRYESPWHHQPRSNSRGTSPGRNSPTSHAMPSPPHPPSSQAPQPSSSGTAARQGPADSCRHRTSRPPSPSPSALFRLLRRT
ncbi:hypothetical protein C8R43DRAFT_1127604 [Mycena crocata]|nr:hypothetical protein C8R43DRAFT_1127604 [Mycena crocata]